MQAEKKPMTKKQYFDKCKKFDNLRNKVASDPYRMKFHLQPPLGWLNDPNGLCQIGSQYHIYFQYTPFNPNGGTVFIMKSVRIHEMTASGTKSFRF